MFQDQESSPYGITGDYIETVVPMIDYPAKDEALEQVDAVDPVLNVLYFYRKPKSSRTQPLAQTDSDLDLTSIYKNVSAAQARKRTLIPDVVNGLVDSLDFDNAISIEDKDIEDFNDNIGGKSAQLAEKFRSTYLPMSLSYDHASAYVEAFMRDGLDISEFQIDHDLSHHINAMIKLDALYTIVADLKVPEDLKRLYFEKFIDSLMTEVIGDLKSQKIKTIAERYKMELDNPVGVKTSSMGSVALRSHRANRVDHEEKGSS